MAALFCLRICPGRDVYAMVREEGNQLVQFRGSLVPSWSKDPAVGKMMINARVETLTGNPRFPGAFKNQP